MLPTTSCPKTTRRNVIAFQAADFSQAIYRAGLEYCVWVDIPEDQLEAVFRPFHRLDTARENRTGGSGLGLAIARQLADKNRWRIELKPRSGGGTCAILHAR